MSSKRILITAGPTHEKIDPVRFIGNYSSGKMGFALAQTCAEHGMEVTLIAGPVQLQIEHPNIQRIDVTSAVEMYEAALTHFPTQDAAILCAAVADYRPEQMHSQKIKRTGDDLVIRLVPNPDIAARLGQMAQPRQVMVGFALETDNEETHALGKMERKNLDMIVLNSLRDAGAGFQGETNKITLLYRNGTIEPYPLKLKTAVAEDIVVALEQLLKEKSEKI